MNHFFRILGAVVLFVLAGCSKEKEILTGKQASITIYPNGTRTAMSGNNISFVNNDVSAIYVYTDENSLIHNLSMQYSAEEDAFRATYMPSVSPEPFSGEAHYYSYYPHSSLSGNNQVKGMLPFNQKAPFDSKANFMCAKADGHFDYEGNSNINITYKQVMGLVRITVKNTGDLLTGEKLTGIAIKSIDGDVLCGEFTMPVGGSTPNFKTNALSSRDEVVSTFASGQQLKKNIEISTNIFVKPTTLKTGSVIRIITDKAVYEIPTKRDLQIIAGNLTVLPVIRLDDTTAPSRKITTIVCTGDSYTACGYPQVLQNLVGPSFKVENAGSSGDNALNISCRQGGVPFGNKTAFTIPETCTGVDFGGRVALLNQSLAESPASINHSTQRINPVEVNGVLGNINGNIFTRLTPGEAVEVAANTRFIPNSRKVDAEAIHVIYMGQNGGYSANTAKGWSANEVLYRMHLMMTEWIRDGRYVVLGFHNPQKYTSDYYNLFTSEDHFGKNNPETGFVSHFVDLYGEVLYNTEKVLVDEMHYISSIDALSEQDRKCIFENRTWPAPFYTTYPTDIHPGPTGNLYMATLVYRKLRELGYLDN